MDKIQRSILKYHPSIGAVNFDEPNDIPSQAQALQYVKDNLLTTSGVEDKYLIWGERNGNAAAGTQYAFGNGAGASNSLVIPRDSRLTGLCYSGDGAVSNLEVGFYVGGVLLTSRVFTGNSWALDIDEPIPAGSVVRLQIVSGNVSSDHRVAAEITRDFNVQTIKGEKGDKGADGDLSWKGTWNNLTVYDKNEAFFYQGSSYITLALTVAGENPTNTPTKFDALAIAPTTSAVSLINLIKTSNQSNANSPTPVEIIFEAEQIPTTNATDLQKSGNGVLCGKSGIVEVSCNIGIFSSDQRINLLVFILLDRAGIITTYGPTKSFYIRDANGQQESSGTLIYPIEVQAGDIITLTSQQEGNAGTAILNANECNLYIKYV